MFNKFRGFLLLSFFLLCFVLFYSMLCPYSLQCTGLPVVLKCVYGVFLICYLEYINVDLKTYPPGFLPRCFLSWCIHKVLGTTYQPTTSVNCPQTRGPNIRKTQNSKSQITVQLRGQITNKHCSKNFAPKNTKMASGTVHNHNTRHDHSPSKLFIPLKCFLQAMESCRTDSHLSFISSHLEILNFCGGLSTCLEDLLSL